MAQTFRALTPALIWACSLGALGAAQEPAAPAGEQVPANTQGPRIVALRVEGNSRASTEQVLGVLGLSVDAPLDLAALDAGILELWNSFRARATVLRADRAGGVELLVQVVEIPIDLEPRFVGNVEIETERILEWAQLSETSELFVSDAVRVRDRLLAGYRQEGFHWADVRIVERAAGPDLAADVIFEIQEGPRVKVADVVLHGNRALAEGGSLFTTGGLKDLADVHLDESRFFGFFRDEFVQEDLDADLVAMRQVYRDRGYLDAVVELERLEFNDERDLVTIHVQIDEGPLYTVESVELVAVVPGTANGELVLAPLVFPEAELRGLLRLAPGDPLRRRVIDADRIALRDYYGERGHPAHDSLAAGEGWEFEEPELEIDTQSKRVRVTYRIAQGEKQFLREILFSGAENTQDRVMRRLVTLNPGEQADLKEIYKSLNRLRGTGYFTDTRDPSRPVEPRFRFKDTDKSGWKDLEFLLEEGDVLGTSFSIGAGGSFGVFGTVSLTLRNFDITDTPDSWVPWDLVQEMVDREAFHGAGQELTLLVQPGTKFTRYQVRFREPDILRSHIDRVSLELEAERTQRFRKLYDEERNEFGFDLGRQISPDATIFAGYSHALVDISDIEAGSEPSLGQPLAVPVLLKEQEGESNLSRVRFGMRYRTLNALINPTEGHSIRGVLSGYDGAWGSDYDFSSLEFSYERYGLFGDPEQGSRPGWRLAFEAGVAVPYGDTDDVPYSERFYFGGSRTLRGFDFQGVGPNENGEAMGGQTKLYGSAEYRFPLLKDNPADGERQREFVQGRLFVDAGILDIDSFELDLSNTRVSAGFGLYLTVPLPIGFTFGFPLIQGEDDSTQVFSLGIGAF
ncbi:MAG: outer membrane protein assembly factor [Planctomycetes bacterium]|nr:outer membrane protein assembly factor [Planctomycetota bacterium]